VKLRLVLTGLAVLAATILPTAASAGQDGGRGHWLSLPPDLTTKYLQGHHPHRDPVHPDARYRHRRLSTADNRGVDRFNGEVETIPAGDLCDFDVELRNWGATPFWEWTDKQGEIVHAVANPDVRSRWSANGRSFWTIDEGWDYFWPNPGRHRVHRGDRHPLLGPRQAPQVPHVRDLAPVLRPGGAAVREVLPRQDLGLGRHRHRHQLQDLRVPELSPASR
jgi:hypothetical protein